MSFALFIRSVPSVCTSSLLGTVRRARSVELPIGHQDMRFSAWIRFDGISCERVEPIGPALHDRSYKHAYVIECYEEYISLHVALHILTPAASTG